MKTLRSLLGPKNRLDVVAGLCDGILTALTLAAGKLLGPQAGISLSLSLRVAVAAAVSSAFVFFVAHYAVLRSDLYEAERQLNLTERGRMATTRLGNMVLEEAGCQALVSSLCSFSGALLPLLVGVWLPALGILVALAALALLGAFLGNTVHGRPLSWAVSLVVGGVVLAWVGFYLKIV